jgi:antirestriction protein ArdC
MNKNEFLNGITMSIIDKLSKGTLPWRRSWKTGVPANFVSKRAYIGINFISLILKDYPSPYYLTFLQCKERSGTINRGSSGCPVIYWEVKEFPSASEDEKQKRVPIVRLSYVFNLSQTSLYNENILETILSCEELIARMPVKPIIKHNIRGCYYSPAGDYISIPKIEDFETKEEYYSALFHEMIHWTGHETRINRIASGRYGDNDYAYEELVAELGAAYLCSLCGISNMTINYHASYINGWLKLMKRDARMLLKASTETGRAIRMLSSHTETG